MKLQSAVDITRSIVESIAPVFMIDSWTFDSASNEFTLKTCDTFYLMPCKTIEIDGKKFTIVSMIQDEQIIISPSLSGVETIDVDSFPIYKPFFFHGSPLNVNSELSNIQFDTEKTPTVYLWETLNELHHEKHSGSPISFEYNAKIFFLDSADWAGWTTDQHKNNVIDPMKALANEFRKKINKDRKHFVQLEDFSTVPRANFGVYQKDLGVMSSYFTDMMSGVEFNSVIKYKRFPCEKQCL